MATIRPLERADLAAVATLVRQNLLGWRRDEAFLARTLVDHPWTPDPAPSLVALDDSGTIIGSIGAQSRRLLFDGAPLRGISVSHLVVAPDRRAGAAGALLVRQLLAGDQDLTWTDSGTDDVVRIWRTFGAHLDHVRSSNWMLVLRPVRWLAHVARLRVVSGAGLRHAVPVTSLPLQAAGRRLLPQAPSPSSSGQVHGEDASSGEIVELLPVLAKSVRLRVDYDSEYLASVLENAGSPGGPVVLRLVRRGPKPIGWYAYIRQPGVSRLIHLAGAGREVEAVFGELIEHARDRGASLLAGRLEPHLQEPLQRRYAALSLAQRPLVHARDPELRATLASGRSLITEMDLIDSEWW